MTPETKKKTRELLVESISKLETVQSAIGTEIKSPFAVNEKINDIRFLISSVICILDGSK